MKEKKKESTIIIVIALALVCVCVAAVIGISAIIRNSKELTPEVIDTLEPPQPTNVEVEVPEIATEEEITVNIEFGNATSEQQIQEEVIVVEEPEAPTPVGDVYDPETPPTYDLPPVEEQPTEPVVVPTQPSDAESHPGEVYLQGFGWVPATQGESIPAPDLVPNGNIIGDM